MARKYINNKQMFKIMQDYIARCRQEEIRAYNLGKEPYYPQVPNYIGECLQLIANNLAKKGNFAGYPFKEEMISDGIENAILYIKNFDPQKSDNPFAYFTQIIKFAFIRRIEKEKKQMYIKHKVFEDLQILDAVEGAGSIPVELNDISQDFVKTYEKRAEEKKLLTQKRKFAKLKETSNSLNFEV
jgi:hypothetical protein